MDGWLRLGSDPSVARFEGVHALLNNNPIAHFLLQEGAPDLEDYFSVDDHSHPIKIFLIICTCLNLARISMIGSDGCYHRLRNNYFSVAIENRLDLCARTFR